MKSRVPKVLQTVGGQSMIIHVLDTALQLQPAGIHVVFNPKAPEVRESCSDYDITWAAQVHQLGTGHAVQQAMPGVPGDANVLVLYGDIPLLESDVLRNLVESPSDGIKVLTMDISNPTGYGRIVRDENGNVTGIVEERDATEAQRAITEVNSGIIMATRSDMVSCLENMASDNSQTAPRSGSLKLWNSSITTAATSSKPNSPGCSNRLSRISATTTRMRASGLTRRLPVTSPTSPAENPQRTAASCISRNFCSVRAISGVV